jgi:hypothetical protein
MLKRLSGPDRAKVSTIPLIDIGQMRQAVSYQVEG